MDDNWIVENLEGAFATWNSKLTEIWSLVSETPQHFKNGAIWAVCQNINTALQAIGYGLLILFFAISIFRSTANFQDFRRPEQALRHFIRFVAAKTAVTYGMDIMTTLFYHLRRYRQHGGGQSRKSHRRICDAPRGNQDCH